MSLHIVKCLLASKHFSELFTDSDVNKELMRDIDTKSKIHDLIKVINTININITENSNIKYQPKTLNCMIKLLMQDRHDILDDIIELYAFIINYLIENTSYKVKVSCKGNIKNTGDRINLHIIKKYAFYYDKYSFLIEKLICNIVTYGFCIDCENPININISPFEVLTLTPTYKCNSLQNMLDYYFEDYSIPTHTCDKCNKTYNYHKCIFRHPKILSLNILRANHTHLEFSKTLDLTKHIFDNKVYNQSTPIVYNLFGIILDNGDNQISYYYKNQKWYWVKQEHDIYTINEYCSNILEDPFIKVRGVLFLYELNN